LSLDAAVEQLLRTVAETAIAPHYRQLAADQVFTKDADDVVTVADRLSEEMLAEGLAKIMPGLAVVGEEAAHADPAVLDRLAGDCWIVDPLDGTRNFAKGQAPFGILLAMASGGVAHSGWILDVLTGRLCTARLGNGAWVDGEKVQARTTGQDRSVAAISMLFMDQDKRAAMMEHIAPHYTLVDVPYCAAEQYPRLALGTNDVSIFERTLAWDHAAGVLWLNEAGGKATRPDGSPYRVDEWARKGLVGAANPHLWEQMVRRLDQLA